MALRSDFPPSSRRLVYKLELLTPASNVRNKSSVMYGLGEVYINTLVSGMDKLLTSTDACETSADNTCTI